MSDEPTERDVEALADSIAVCFSNVSDLPEWMRVPALGRDMRPLTLIAARAVLRSDRYVERIAQARREGAAEVTARVEAASCECGGDAVRYTVGADRRCPVHGYGDTVPWLHLRAVLRDTP